jgi:hypothetical protein
MRHRHLRIARAGRSAAVTDPLRSFIKVAGEPTSPWILHVPHASTRIPGWVRERIVIDDERSTPSSGQ